MSNPPPLRVPNILNTNTNTNKSTLLTLPPDILTEIIFDYLTPRDAISLSITCRHFFHGALSQYNTRFWHKIGGFSTGRLPGYSKEWLDVGYIMLEVFAEGVAGRNVREAEAENTDPHNSFNDLLHDLNDYVTEIQVETTAGRKHMRGNNSNLPCLTTKEFQNLSKNHLIWYPPIASPNESLGPRNNENNSEGNKGSKEVEGIVTKGYVVNYRLMLVDTMVGAANTGCQWCLRWPHFSDDRASANELGIAICNKCFEENILPLRALKPIRKVDPSTLTLIHTYRSWPLDEITTPGLNVRGENCWIQDNPRVIKPSTRVRFDGVWRPQLQRRVWQQYGLNKSVDTLLGSDYRNFRAEVLWRNGYLIKERNEDWGLRYLQTLAENNTSLPIRPRYMYQYYGCMKTRRLLDSGILTKGKRLHLYY